MQEDRPHLAFTERSFVDSQQSVEPIETINAPCQNDRPKAVARRMEERIWGLQNNS